MQPLAYFVNGNIKLCFIKKIEKTKLENYFWEAKYLKVKNKQGKDACCFFFLILYSHIL